MKLKADEISNAVNIICENPARPVSWFMDGFGIDYDEWSYLSFAAVPAMAHKAYAHELKNRLGSFLADAQHVLWNMHDLLDSDRIGKRELLKIAASLDRAIVTCRTRQATDYEEGDSE